MTALDAVDATPEQPPSPGFEQASIVSSRAVWLRLIPWVIGVAAFAVLAVLLDADTVDLRGLMQSARGAGAAGCGVFILLYAACTLTPLPRNVLSTTGGAIFGFWLALPLVYLGSLLGASVGFWLARRLGRDALRRLGGARTAALNERLARQGLVTVLSARVAPVVPFTAVNYAAGLSDISRRTYVLGTAVGIVPGTITYVAMGAFASARMSWPFEVATAGLLIVGMAAILRRRPGVARNLKWS